MFEFQWMTPYFDGDGGGGGSPAAEPTTEAASPEQSEPPSVEAGDNPDAGTAPVSGSDVSQQESFAKRLKEEVSKKEQEYQPYRERAEQIERIAKDAGFQTSEEYLAALDEHVRQQRAEAEAQRLGVDPDTYNQFFAPVHDELNKTKAELERLRQSDIERQVRSEDARLASQYSDYNDVRDQVFKVAGERALPLEDAYKIVTWESRIAAARQEAEQEVLANVTGRDQKQVLPGNDKGSPVSMDPSAMSLNDIEEISRRVQRGERITF